MRNASVILRMALAGALAVGLSGCGSLFGGGKPAHLYRFGQPPGAEAAAAPAGRVGVFRANGTFQRESAGDKILTINGGKAAYVAETRWVAPAQALFDQAVLAAFDADPGRVRIISRGEPASTDYILRLDVRNFEAVHEGGAKSAPTVVVRVRAAITTDGQKTLVSDRIFESRVQASQNRVTAIVAAFDEATQGVLKELVAWTNDQARPRA